MPDRELDIVLYGATGFVGALTAAHLAQHAGPGVRIALAGRSRSKLEALRIELGSDGVVVGARRGRRDRRAGSARPGGAHPCPRHDRRSLCDPRQGGRARLRRVRDALRRPDRRGALRPVVARRARRPGPGDRGRHRARVRLRLHPVRPRACSRRPRRVAADGEGTLAETTLLVRSLKGGFSGGTIDSARQQAITARADARARARSRRPVCAQPPALRGARVRPTAGRRHRRVAGVPGS